MPQSSKQIFLIAVLTIASTLTAKTAIAKAVPETFNGYFLDELQHRCNQGKHKFCQQADQLRKAQRGATLPGNQDQCIIPGRQFSSSEYQPSALSPFCQDHFIQPLQIQPIPVHASESTSSQAGTQLTQLVGQFLGCSRSDYVGTVLRQTEPCLSKDAFCKTVTDWCKPLNP